MIREIIEKTSVTLLLVVVCACIASGQAAPAKPAPPPVPERTAPQIAPETNATVDGNEAMFTVMCALYVAGYEGDVSADHWSTYRARIRERARKQQGPAVEAVREFYQQHQLNDPGAMLSRYVWFGLVSGPAPKFQLVLRRDQLPPDVLALEGLSEILSTYYTEQKIGTLWREVQPVYQREIERLHEPIAQIVLVATSYLRDVLNPGEDRSFSVIVEPLVGRITNVRNYGDHYAIILSGSEEIPTDVVRHAFLHFLIDPLPLRYAHVVVVKRPVFEIAAKAPRLPADLKDDYLSWFGECTVRAVELKLRRLSPSERDAALNKDDADGYVMVRPISGALAIYEKSEPAMKNYYPDLVRGIDVKTEVARASSITFAPAETQEQASQLSKEEVARRVSAMPSTVPNDQEAIAELTEGERRIAERNPRAAEASFKLVLAKYPDQQRAWYGLGLVALLDHDGVRAKEVFGRLTTGEHAATQDPMVMAWSHVYLGRVFEDEGQMDRAKSEYEAGLGVQGAPAQAVQAAQKGLGELASKKATARP